MDLTHVISFFAVENVVFCHMSSLQLSLYQHLLGSRLFKSCLRSKTSTSSGFPGHQFPPHLVCIGALKKLCNTPALIYAAASERERRRVGKENCMLEDCPPVEKVRCVCAAMMISQLEEADSLKECHSFRIFISRVFIAILTSKTYIFKQSNS